MKIGKISAKIHEIGKIMAIFGLGMTPIYGLKNGQIKSLVMAKVHAVSSKLWQKLPQSINELLWHKHSF